MTNNGPDEHILSDVTATILGTQSENHGAAWNRDGVINVGVIKDLTFIHFILFHWF